MFTFNHFNFNVTDLDRSLAFYKEALGLEPVGTRKVAEDGSFVIVYLGDGKTDFRLELFPTYPRAINRNSSCLHIRV